MKVEGEWLRDDEGRILLLRGVNLGGSSKVPVAPDGATWKAEGFYDWRNVSFVGRPFPLAEAEEHFGRFASWGFRFVRLMVTWEAVEHAGPGQYDREYLAYLRALVEAAGRRGLEILVDPHQDVWSRWTGGDGAPAWTLEAAGFRLDGRATPGPRGAQPRRRARLGSGTRVHLEAPGRVERRRGNPRGTTAPPLPLPGPARRRVPQAIRRPLRRRAAEDPSRGHPLLRGHAKRGAAELAAS